MASSSSSPAYTPAVPPYRADHREADPPPFSTHEELSLQWLFSASDMPFTPSVTLAGISPEQERAQRWKGVHFLCRIAEYARLGNHVIATSAYFFHRFYMRRPLTPPSSVTPSSLPRGVETWAHQEMAPTCLWLACKVEESHRKLHSIVEATMALNDRTPDGMQAAEQGRYRADPNSKDYSRWKDTILLNEERLLETLCFDLIIEQPHPLAVKACKRLGTDVDLARLTVVLLNSLLYGAVCTFFDAPILAACAFRIACNMTETDADQFAAGAIVRSSKSGANGAGPSNESRLGWLEVFDVSQEELEEALPVVQEFLDYHMESLSSRAYPKADPRLHGGQNGSNNGSGGVTPHHGGHGGGANTPRSGGAHALGSSSSSTPYAPAPHPTSATGMSQGLGTEPPRLPSTTPPPLPPPPPLRVVQRDAADVARPPSRHGTVQGQGPGQHKRPWDEGPGASSTGRGQWSETGIPRHGGGADKPVRSPQLSPGAAALGGGDGGGEPEAQRDEGTREGSAPESGEA